ncbi:MAG: DUF1266 domain-containing protein [Lachnospiraceae bacterium]|nr:DUF1266 domain-containing protein [Lachnospiraceae bacterium]MBD5455891.1 DUF1266 domain-containing protein [Lachnospiraceae bacterium]
MELICQNIMLNKIRKTLVLLTALIFLGSLTGCGKDGEPEIVLQEEEEENETQTAEEEEETLEETPTEKPVTMSQLIGNSGNDSNSSAEEEESLPETVLWFNATYAPLTYSNAGNWRLVGGLKPTESNKELVQFLLLRDWGIEDRDSALETVESLKENGHRKKCRDCMEELSQMELLDLEEEAFFQELTDSGIEDYLFRYIIAYYMYREGMDADYIAAWDLCRVNQLYGDFYICGYMTYEEAMEASYDNSLILQEMYSSWDEMVNAYMMGYQFWKNDPALSDDSPTLERYRYYEMLLQLDDGPYTLDWNMDLEKSW